MRGKNKKEKENRGCPLVGHMGPTRGRRTIHGANPHVGIVPHGGAKEVGTPPSPLYRPPCLEKDTEKYRKSGIDFWLTWASPWVDSTLPISRRTSSQVWIVYTGDL